MRLMPKRTSRGTVRLDVQLPQKLARSDPFLADAAAAAALAAAAEIEVWTSASGSTALRAIAAALTTLPLAVRRRAPLAVLALVMGSLLGQSVVDPHADVPGVLVVAFLLAAYSVAAHAPRNVAVGGGVLGIAALSASTHLQGGGVGNYIFASALFGALWIAGFALRSRRLRAEELELHASALELDQEARARTAVAEERARIARDLHDVVAHSMSVIVVQAGAERLALPEGAGSTRDVLQSIESTGRQALVEMRRLVELLRADDEQLALAPQPSLAHLDLLIQQLREAGLPVELRVEGEPVGVPPGVDLSAYRIVQEALTNALKHAGPARALVTLRYLPEALELEVADDGPGGDGADGGGHGLAGMRERVAVFGGVLESGRRAEGGYRLRATLPLGGAR